MLQLVGCTMRIGSSCLSLCLPVYLSVRNDKVGSHSFDFNQI